MDELLVALDVDTATEARNLADQLRGTVGGFKIGSQLFTSHGPAIVEELAGRGDRVFLDLKFHDIPNTVAGAVRAAARLGVWMVNVHASGGAAMMRAARAAASEEAARSSRTGPLIVAVTMLTSLSEGMLGEIGVSGPMAAQVERLAALTQAAGLDGVVASPLEIPLIRATCGQAFVIVTPGIRGGAAQAERTGEDQSRTLTAGQALSAGATYLVVGRPIIAAADPRAAAERIAEECRAALARRVSVTIYSRPDCHLCDDMKAVVARVARWLPVTLEDIDISTDPKLEASYGPEVPVLMIGGRKAAKYRVTEDELRRLLLARAPSLPTSPSR
jgi:orotidine-5'-phosphate decarboxylase